MPNRHKLASWLDQKLRERGHGAKKALADHLGIQPNAISRMIGSAGKLRRIEAHAIPAMAAFFGEWPPGFPDSTRRPMSPALRQPGATGMDEGADEPRVTINVDAHQGTLIVGGNNTVTTNNEAVGATISAKQAVKLEQGVQAVATARRVEATETWGELCSALEVADSTLITRAAFPQAEKLLAAWAARAVREAVNEKADEANHRPPR